MAEAEKVLAAARAEAYQKGEFPGPGLTTQKTWDEMAVAKEKKAGDSTSRS